MSALATDQILGLAPSRDRAPAGVGHADERSRANLAPQSPELPVVTYPKGVVLFEQGQTLGDVCYLRSGMVKLTCVAASGRGSILSLAFAGEWLGTAAAIAREPVPVSASACTPVVVGRIPAEVFRQRLRSNDHWASHFHQIHAQELCRQSAWTAQLSCNTAEQRLRTLLCHFVSKLEIVNRGRGFRLALPLQHCEIAALLAVTPEHLSRLLKAIESQGLIRREKGWIVIAEPDHLCSDGMAPAPWPSMAPALQATPIGHQVEDCQ